jgi:hypothetical protein
MIVEVKESGMITIPELTADLVKEMHIHTTVTRIRQAFAVKDEIYCEIEKDENGEIVKDLPISGMRFRIEGPITTTMVEGEDGEEVEKSEVEVSVHVLSRDLERYLLLESLQSATETEQPAETE